MTGTPRIVTLKIFSVYVSLTKPLVKDARSAIMVPFLTSIAISVILSSVRSEGCEQVANSIECLPTCGTTGRSCWIEGFNPKPGVSPRGRILCSLISQGDVHLANAELEVHEEVSPQVVEFAPFSGCAQIESVVIAHGRRPEAAIWLTREQRWNESGFAGFKWVSDSEGSQSAQSRTWEEDGKAPTLSFKAPEVPTVNLVLQRSGVYRRVWLIPVLRKNLTVKHIAHFSQIDDTPVMHGRFEGLKVRRAHGVPFFTEVAL